MLQMGLVISDDRMLLQALGESLLEGRAAIYAWKGAELRRQSLRWGTSHWRKSRSRGGTWVEHHELFFTSLSIGYVIRTLQTGKDGCAPPAFSHKLWQPSPQRLPYAGEIPSLRS